MKKDALIVTVIIVVLGIIMSYCVMKIVDRFLHCFSTANGVGLETFIACFSAVVIISLPQVIKMFKNR